MKKIISIALILVMMLAFAVPASALTVTDLDDEPVFYDNTTQVLDPANPFTDVLSSSYYGDAVKWAYMWGITTGTSDTTFSPGATCTRGQVVTFLWRTYGEPEPKTKNNPFSDVKTSDYYYKPILWAVEQGITNGTSATTFSPKQQCTNAQIITFLYRAAGNPDTKSPVKYEGKYYGKPMAWGEDYGMFTEIPFAVEPNTDCPRANVVYFLFKTV